MITQIDCSQLLAPLVFSEESYFDISDFEPLCVGEFSHYGEMKKYIAQPIDTIQILNRYKQPKQGDQNNQNLYFIQMMHSHSAIYSAFYHVTKKGLSIVPRNLLDILSIKTTNASILLQQEQKTLLWINDRKLFERMILVDAILQEPGLNNSWNIRLNAMKTQK